METEKSGGTQTQRALAAWFTCVLVSGNHGRFGVLKGKLLSFMHALVLERCSGHRGMQSLVDPTEEGLLQNNVKKCWERLWGSSEDRTEHLTLPEMGAVEGGEGGGHTIFFLRNSREMLKLKTEAKAPQIFIPVPSQMSRLG